MLKQQGRHSRLNHTARQEVEKVLVSGIDFHPTIRFSDIHTAEKGGSEFEVTAYFALQFHALRHYLCGDETSFFRSMLRSEEFQGSGGKSGVSFAITHDRRYIVKQLNRQESSLLLTKGQLLFHYFSQILFHEVPSSLAMVYGLYQVSFRRGGERWKRSFVVMQNLKNLLLQRPLSNAVHSGDKLPAADEGSFPIALFDLKGVERNRNVESIRSVAALQQPSEARGELPQTKSENDLIEKDDDLPDTSPNSAHASSTQSECPVLWDQNFREYSRGLPLTLAGDDFSILRMAIINDTLLLSNLEVVDYSLLVMINESTKMIATGIIDFFRPYTWDKQVETVGKRVQAYITATFAKPTVVSPTDYASRFIGAMGTFFRTSYPTVPYFICFTTRKVRQRKVRQKKREKKFRFLKTCTCHKCV